MHHHYYNYDDRNQYLKGECLLECAKGLIDQAGSVVKWHNSYLRKGTVRQLFRGKSSRNRFDLFLYIINHLKRVFTMPRYNHTAYSFCSRFVESSASLGRAHSYPCNIPDSNGSIVYNGNNAFLKIPDGLNIAQPSHQILRIVHFNGSGAHVQVAFTNGVRDLVHIYARFPHCNRINIHLVLFNISTNTRHLGYAIDRGECVPDLKILNGSKFLRVPSPGGISLRVVPFKRVPENLSQSSGIRTQCRLNTLGKRAAGECVQFFQNS